MGVEGAGGGVYIRLLNVGQGYGGGERERIEGDGSVGMKGRRREQ